MARAQLLRLVLQSAQKAEGDKPGLTTPWLPSNDQPEILVVDDNAFILEAWEGTLKPDARVHVADSLESIELLLAADPMLIDVGRPKSEIKSTGEVFFAGGEKMVVRARLELAACGL